MMCNKGLPDKNELRISELEKKVDYINGQLSRLSTQEVNTRRFVVGARRSFQEWKTRFESVLDGLDERLKLKPGRDEVTNSIMEVIKLYDLGKLPRPWRS